MSVTDVLPGKSLRLGPPTNAFNDVDQATTEAARDAYFSANPSKLAVYNSNTDLLIRLSYFVGPELVVKYQSRFAGSWVDVTPVVEGPPGEVASLENVPIGELPYKTVSGTFAGSNMRVLENGSILAPVGFGVESGSVTFGDVLKLSEVAGFLGISNLLNDRQYTIVDFYTPRTAASSEPTVFHLIESEFEFVSQGVDTTNLPDNPLLFDYVVVNNARTNAIKFRTYAAMTNVRVKISQISNGVALKFLPNKTSWEKEIDGLTWGIGDNTFDFTDSPVILSSGVQLRFEIRADVVALKGNALGVPYFTATLQRGVFDNVITDRVYTATDVKSKLETLLSPNKLSKTAIQDVVNTVNGGFGDVVITTGSIGAQPVDATLTALAGQVTATDGLTYSTGVDTFAQTVLTPFARTILDDTSAAQTRGTLGLGDMALQNAVNVAITGGNITGITDLAIVDGGTGASDAPTARTNLGLGTIATQNSNSVSITGGSVTGITDITVADGGTGSSTASGARTNLGLVIGTDVQAWDNTLQQFSTFGTVADRIFYSAGVDAYGETSLTTYGRSLIDDVDAAAARITLGLGSMAVQNGNSVAITGGSITGITDLAVADGGTGASTASGARTNLGITTGTYTPTLFNTTNVAASTAFVAQYMQVADMVTVSGRVDIDPTNNNQQTILGMSLPVASNLATAEQCAGTSNCSTVAGASAAIFGDPVNDRATIEFVAASNANQSFFFQFMYRVI
jgi:hypothetical protein